ncbi:MAG TPA: Fe-S cluster assembly ATPase SufC [Acidimicrobiales bacterium]|nr:Fe-S cluster assembly ATPase SufC [Acidimicrobiales bacterium]
MSVLEIRDLRASVDGAEILRGIDLTVRSGEVHAVMGPNGSGKSTLSHVLMGHPNYEVTGGSIKLDGQELVGMSTFERATAGMFLAMQYPIEVPGVSVAAVLEAAYTASGRSQSEVAQRMVVEAERIGFDEKFLERPMNVDLSGGEKKRNETLQLGVLEPKIAILDEIDSGLDVDALVAVSRRVEDATNEQGLGVLAITHYKRLLEELQPDQVHVLVKGVIEMSGGPELADELEASGYAAFIPAQPVGLPGLRRSQPDPDADPFADPFA